jgi:hypothetical protein
MAARTAPTSLTGQITTALDRLRAARERGDYSREITWSTMLDRLLDRWSKGHR